MTTFQETVGSVAARSSAALKVLAAHGIDFCCGGSRPLEQACAAVGLDQEHLLAEVEAAEAAAGATETAWGDRPVEQLIAHILDEYHVALRRDIPVLSELSSKVARVHAEDDGERLRALAQTFATLAEDLQAHMEKEEQVLFPWILSGDGAGAGGPIRVMQAEHEAAGHHLARMRELTDDYRVPEAACNGWRALLEGLADMEAHLHQHIHLENNILFPRALAS